MKVFGYVGQAESQSSPSELSEVTIVADADELRQIAGFLVDSANAMELHGEAFGHEHLSDAERTFGSSRVYVIVARPS